jgi:hypothetical protein
MKAAKAAVGVIALASLGACATVSPPIGSDFRAPSDSARILVMEPDVRVNFITTGGAELRADWTEEAKKNLLAALKEELAASGETVIEFNPEDRADDAELQQALLLHRAVANALAAHVVKISPTSFAGQLPHQSSRRETYTLGEGVREIAEGVEADYALFMTSRSQVESGGLVMTKILFSVAATAATGGTTVFVPTGFANFKGTYISLVDLRTGEVVWLGSTNLGDPRDAQSAAAIVSAILNNGPLAPSAR